MEFRAVVESGAIRQDCSGERYWTAVRVPFDPAEAWPGLKEMRVRGTINGFAFRTTLFRTKAADCVLLVNRIMQKRGKATARNTAEIVLEPDMEDSSAAPPVELAKLLRQDRTVKKWFESLNHSMRRYICDEVAGAKSAETRQRRAERWAECLMLVMEAELELPPILQTVFRRQPRGLEAWQALTRIQRRNHLLAIFRAQGPEARLRRAEWAIDAALGGAAGAKRTAREEDYA